MDGEAVFGGCDEKYGIGGGIAIVLLATSILLIWYVSVFVRDKKLLGGVDKMCGGLDQGCVCAGNETFANPNDPRDLNADVLSQVAYGR